MSAALSAPKSVAFTSTEGNYNRPLKPARIRASVEASLTVTPDALHTWEGFGGCFNEHGAVVLESLPKSRRAEVLESLFGKSGLGLSIGRLPIGASDYAIDWYSLNDTPGDFAMKRFSIDRDRRCLLPYVHAALAVRPDLMLFASPWSPPTWLKQPSVYNHGTVPQTKKYLHAYALYFARFVEAYAKEGVRIRQVHPQNEPVADQKFPSCLWTGPQLTTFLRDHLAPVFKSRGLGNVELWMGTLNTDDFAGFVLHPMLDAKARGLIAGVGLQWAGKGMVQRVRHSFPHLRLMQTENECGDGKNTWAYAEYVFDLARHYIANGTSSYVYWNMLLPPGGRSSWGWNQNALITIDPATRAVTYNPEYHVFRHLAAHVRPGASVHATAGAWSAQSLAFVHPSASTTVVVCNPLPTDQPLTLKSGATTLAYQLPARSISTIVV